MIEVEAPWMETSSEYHLKENMTELLSQPETGLEIRIRVELQVGESSG